MKHAAKRDKKAGRKLKRKAYDEELRRLQAELCQLQEWVKATGQRIVVVFEGRDAAGKGGTIKAITERVSPRVFRVVALPAPSDREKTQLYVQRYIQHFPAAGEIVIFDRSWYNRAGVEYVLGFCTAKQHRQFLRGLPALREAVHRRAGSGCSSTGWRSARRAEAALRGAHRGPAAPVEAQPDRPRVAPALVRVLARPRPDARGHRHEVRAVAHRPVRRQEAGAPRTCIAAPPGARSRTSACKREKVKPVDRSRKHAYDDEAPMRRRSWIPEVY